jgi:hypothetical protein
VRVDSLGYVYGCGYKCGVSHIFGSDNVPAGAVALSPPRGKRTSSTSLIPASPQTVVIPSSGLNGKTYTTSTTLTTNDNIINVTTHSQTSANTNAHFPRHLLFLGYAMGFQIWDCTNLSPVSEVLSLLAWSVAATLFRLLLGWELGGGGL